MARWAYRRRLPRMRRQAKTKQETTIRELPASAPERNSAPNPWLGRLRGPLARVRALHAAALRHVNRVTCRSAGQSRRRKPHRREDLEQGLLNESVEHRGDAQHPYALSVRFGNLHVPDRVRDIRAAEQLLSGSRPMPAAVGH
jgi:hypothetical protein